MKSRQSIWIVAAALALACSSGEEPAKPAPAPPATEKPAPPAPAPEPEKAPEPPPSARPADAARGAPLYATYCATCHGPEGNGDGPAAAGLEPKPASHSDGTYMNTLSNEHLFKVIKEGGPAVGKSPLMAPWGGTLSDEQIRDVIAFVRTLAKPPYTGPQP